MRSSIAAAVVLAAVLPAAAQDTDPATIDLVVAAATKDYADPGAARVTHIRKSRALNGSGYCGEVTVEGGAEVTPFHVVLVTPDGNPSVLRLSDFPTPDTDPQAETVHAILRHFGCTE